MTRKTYKIRVAVTHKLSEEALRGLWQYHREGVEFQLASAIALARRELSRNPEMESQIQEGLEALEQAGHAPEWDMTAHRENEAKVRCPECDGTHPAAECESDE